MNDGAVEANQRAEDPAPGGDFSQTHWPTVLRAQGSLPRTHRGWKAA